MNKKIIAAVAIFFLSYRASYSEKLELIDSLERILDSYNEYVPDLRTKRFEVVVLVLPDNLINVENGYLNETDARKLCQSQGYEIESAFESILSKAEVEIDKKVKDDRFNNLFDEHKRKLRIEDFKYYFIDPSNCNQESTDIIDVLAPTCFEVFKKIIRNKEFGVNKDIEELLFSKNYIDNAKKTTNLTDVPDLLKELVQKALGISFKLLNKSELEEVKKEKIYFTNPRGDASLLWVSNDDNSIFISPYLIRATFFSALNSTMFRGFLVDQLNGFDHDYDFPIFGYDGIAKWIRYNRPEAESIVRKFYTNFIESFTFALSHELAHKYRNDKNSLQAEIRCDCSAINHLRQKYKTVNLGLFRSILLESISHNLYYVWGNENINELRVRDYYIDKFLNKETDCESISINDIKSMLDKFEAAEVK